MKKNLTLFLLTLIITVSGGMNMKPKINGENKKQFSVFEKKEVENRELFCRRKATVTVVNEYGDSYEVTVTKGHLFMSCEKAYKKALAAAKKVAEEMAN